MPRVGRIGSREVPFPWRSTRRSAFVGTRTIGCFPSDVTSDESADASYFSLFTCHSPTIEVQDEIYNYAIKLLARREHSNPSAADAAGA